MRNALDPAYSSISRKPVSAMMTFLEYLDRDLPKWPISSQTGAMIAPRIELCRQIVEQRRQDCVAQHREPPSSTEFREMILRNGVDQYGFAIMHGFGQDGDNVAQVVYDNPIYTDVQMPMFVPPLYWELLSYWT